MGDSCFYFATDHQPHVEHTALGLPCSRSDGEVDTLPTFVLEHSGHSRPTFTTNLLSNNFTTNRRSPSLHPGDQSPTVLCVLTSLVHFGSSHKLPWLPRELSKSWPHCVNSGRPSLLANWIQHRSAIAPKLPSHPPANTTKYAMAQANCHLNCQTYLCKCTIRWCINKPATTWCRQFKMSHNSPPAEDPALSPVDLSRSGE